MFEDPDEKQLKIKSNIEHSKFKKRQRLNSGASNSSKGRQSQCYEPHKYLSHSQVESNADLLRLFNQDVARCEGLSLDSIYQTFKSEHLQQQVLQSFSEAHSQIRMEEPARVLLRLSLNFVRELFLKSHERRDGAKHPPQMESASRLQLKTQVPPYACLSNCQANY